MTAVGNRTPITVTSGFARDIWIGEDFQSRVGDLVVCSLQTLPTGQVRRCERSLLSHTDQPIRYPTCAMFSILHAAAFSAGELLNPELNPICDLPAAEVRSDVLNPAVVDFVQRQQHGVIAYSGDVTAASIILDVCRSYPTQKVLIVSPHARECCRLFASIRRLDRLSMPSIPSLTSRSTIVANISPPSIPVGGYNFVDRVTAGRALRNRHRAF